ncbi:hypothetical protein RB195_024324 [Necator americanus]|uniref:Uncharacterized protein n=1 Tax=Necator americanus TaxID=51031 RepID=A0ABR1EMN8_NECAM
MVHVNENEAIVRNERSQLPTTPKSSGGYLLICQRGAARAAGNQELTGELARICREAIKEHLKEKRAEVLAEAAEAAIRIRYARRDFASRKTRMPAFRNPKGTTIASRRGIE